MKKNFEDFVKKAEKHIAALNRLANECKECGPIEKCYILDGLKRSGIPTNNNFWSVFVKANFIKNYGKGLYAFVNTQPIHKIELARIYRDYRDISKHYIDAYKANKKEKQVSELVIVSEQEAIEQAITLLKNTGEYIILKKSVTYQEL